MTQRELPKRGTAPDKTRAKRLILEILRQAGGSLGKTLLFKAFWISHLYYSKKARGYLTDWPIVRTPRGPGIDKGDKLIRELAESGAIRQDHEARGPYTEINCKLTEQPIEGEMPEAAIQAIKTAVEDVKRHSAASISEWSHEFSRSWNNTPDGSELNIYTDLIPDDVYDDRQKELVELKKAYEDLFE
jgi:hypothetical protein